MSARRGGSTDADGVEPGVSSASAQTMEDPDAYYPRHRIVGGRSVSRVRYFVDSCISHADRVV